MGESSRRSRKRHSKRKERRSKPARSEEETASPPSYSVEENSKGEWVNARLNVKWPEPVDNYDVSKHRYLALADPPSDRGSSRRSRKKRSKRKKRDHSKRSSRAARSPEKESQYITLSTGSETDNSSDRSKRVRRERKRMVVQTSPQVSRKSRSGFVTDEDGKKIDSIVFDTRSEMMRYQKSDDIIPSRRRPTNRSKKPSVADQMENEEYNRFYVGVKSRRSVENRLKRPGEFALYYEKPRDGYLPDSVNLKIAYFSSGSQEYHHFPIQCFKGTDGHNNYVVMQNQSDGKMFTSILSLVKHYSLYSHVDTSTGRLETFSVSH